MPGCHSQMCGSGIREDDLLYLPEDAFSSVRIKEGVDDIRGAPDLHGEAGRTVHLFQRIIRERQDRGDLRLTELLTVSLHLSTPRDRCFCLTGGLFFSSNIRRIDR